MKSLGISTAVFIISATQAVALTCLPPNIARTFNEVNASKDSYVMAQGILTPKGWVPKYKPGKARKISTDFNGVLLNSSGQTDQQKFTVTVDAICFASWCGGLPDKTQEVVAFFKQTATGYRLETTPCGGNYKTAPTPEDIHLLQSCMKKGGCSKAQIKSLDKY